MQGEGEDIVVEIEGDKPVEVELEGNKPEAAAAEPELPLEPKEPALEGANKEDEPGEPAAPAPAPQAPPQPDPVAELQEQLKRLRAQAHAERQAREEAERELGAAGAEVYRSRMAQAHSDLNAIVNALSAEKNEAEIAESAYAKAAADGDWDAAAKAQRVIARCEARVASLEDGKSQLEGWIRARGNRTPEPRAPQRQAPTPQGSGDPIEDYITSRSERVQSYLRARPREWLSDTKQNHKLIAAHNTALAEGYAEESPGYFAVIDQQMGLKTEMKTEVPVKKEPPKQPKASQPAAPVTSKGAPGAALNGGGQRRVTLTAAQVDAAKAMGLTPAEYGRRLYLMSQPGYQGPKFGVNG